MKKIFVNSNLGSYRVAIIHDWLTGMRGGERCLEVFLSLFPDAEVFTLVYQPSAVTPLIRERNVTASFLNLIPGIAKFYRYLLPFYPQAARNIGKKLAQSHQRKPFDMVISISHCAAKNVPVPQGISHLCYCLTPVRYIWDQYDSYFAGKLEEPIVRRLLPRFRRWDIDGAKGVTSFAAISSFVRERIKNYYERDAVVIFPPVRSDWIEPRTAGQEGEGFLCVNALVPYKNVDRIIEAFNHSGDKLTIVGDGPERVKLESMARPNIRFLRNLTDQELAELYRSSKALIFAAEEDFGMTPVEMQFAGRPVIAYEKGGALETV